MRDRARLLLLGVSLLSLPHTVVAQGVAEARAAAEQLLERYQSERVASERVTAAEQRLRQSDTVETGALRLVVRQADRPIAEAAAKLAWPVIRARYGRMADVMAQHPIMVSPVDSTAKEYGAFVMLPDRSSTAQNFGAGPSRISAGLIRFADMLLWASADSALRAWYPSSPDPGIDSSVTAERVYLELVTSLSVQARSCLIGDDRACSEALGLRAVGDPLIESFDPAGRRALAGRLSESREGQRMVMRYQACLDDGDDGACVELLRAALGDSGRYDAFRLPNGVGDAPRRALVAEVERLGGAEAWGRLVASDGRPLEARFALAAGVPADSLMRVWRRTLIAARPTNINVSVGSLLIALLWFGLGLAFALRFSRWY
jgi:hypothetical protein